MSAQKVTLQSVLNNADAYTNLSRASIQQLQAEYNALFLNADQNERSIPVLESILTWPELPMLVKQKVRHLIKHAKHANKLIVAARGETAVQS